MKKILSLVLAIILIFAFIPANLPVNALNGIRIKEIVLDKEYLFIGEFSEELAYVYFGNWENKKMGFINKTGKEIIPCIYENVSNFSEGLAAVQKNGKWGFIDKTGKEVIPFIYTGVNDVFKKGVAVVRIYGKTGLIDKTGKEIIPCFYDYIYIGDYINGNIFSVYKNRKIGFIDITGKVITPCIYDFVNVFKDGFAFVAVGDIYEKAKWGVIDETGKEVIPCIYEYGDVFNDGLAIVKKDGKWGVIDTTGKIIASFKDWFGYFNDGLASVQKDGKWGFIDKTGNTVIPFIYDDDQDSWRYFFEKGVSFAKKDGKWGLIDKTGKILAPFIYDNFYGFNWDGLDGGLAQVLKYPKNTDNAYAISLYHNIKYGFIDRTGKEVIPCIYDYVPFINLYFSEDMAVVGEYFQWNGGTLGSAEYRFGYIDKKNNLVIPYIYHNAGPFNEGFAIVGEISERSGMHYGPIAYKFGLIDKTGKEILPMVYDSITNFKDGIAVAQKGNKCSILKIIYPTNGTPLGDVLYSDITAYINGSIIPTSVINGKTLVVVEDLANYGFDVSWGSVTRSLKVELNKNKKITPLSVIKDTKNKPGKVKCKYLYTDIKTYLSGKIVESYAIDGVTLIDFELLEQYGKISWDGKNREIKLTIN